MLTLRLTEFSEGQNRYRVAVASEGEGLPRQTAFTRFDFELAAQEQESLRWYLEDYLQYPSDPAPQIAARIERRMAEIGTDLFKAVFQTNDDASDLWATLRPQLNDTRVEVVTDVRGAAAIPWELVRDSKADVLLALRARAFVRARPQPAQRPYLPTATPGPIRILLVICRPGGHEDVPFRSVAMRIFKGLDASAREAFQLEVLRPPTFDQLSQVLRAVKAVGKPYHIVHFDGHGLFLDVEELLKGSKGTTDEEVMKLLSSLTGFDPHRFSPQAIYPHPPRPGHRGYLAFENPKSEHNLHLVDGPEAGRTASRNWGAGAGAQRLPLGARRAAAEPETPRQPQPTPTPRCGPSARWRRR